EHEAVGGKHPPPFFYGKSSADDEAVQSTEVGNDARSGELAHANEKHPGNDQRGAAEGNEDGGAGTAKGERGVRIFARGLHNGELLTSHVVQTHRTSAKNTYETARVAWERRDAQPPTSRKRREAAVPVCPRHG